MYCIASGRCPPWAHPDCSVVRERAPCLPLGATRSCVHISSRAVTHSRGERVLSWGQHLCSPAKKARQTLRGQAAVQHSALCAASAKGPSRRAQRLAGGMGELTGSTVNAGCANPLSKKAKKMCVREWWWTIPFCVNNFYPSNKIIHHWIKTVTDKS